MNLNKSTRYALYAVTEMARADADGPVTAMRVAELHGIPAAVTAKVFQQLVRAGIAVGTRGTKGGYRLARAASGITVLDVLDVFEPAPGAGNPTNDDDPDRLQRLLDEVNGLVRATFASVTVATLAGLRGRH